MQRLLSCAASIPSLLEATDKLEQDETGSKDTSRTRATYESFVQTVESLEQWRLSFQHNTDTVLTTSTASP